MFLTGRPARPNWAPTQRSRVSSSRPALNYAKYNQLPTILLLLAAALCLTAPIFLCGVPDGNDVPQHFRFAHTFYDAVSDGDYFPSWPGTTNHGFGDVGIRFYPPLAYYTVAVFRVFVDSWNDAFALAICLWFFVGGVGLYLLALEWTSERPALVGALVFMAMPYHANQVYNAGLFAEFAGLAILPFCLLFVRRVISSGRLQDVLGLSVAYALLLLTHLPLAVIGSISLLVFAIVSLRDEKPKTIL